MGERVHLPVPMWVSQCQLLGGLPRIIAVAVLCVGGLTVGFFGFAHLGPHEPWSAVAGRAIFAVPPLLALILVLGGCSAIHRALLRDQSTNMRDSHRLTPMSSTGVVLGYLFGSTLQILVIFVVVVGFGAVLTVLNGGGITPWLGGCLLMLSGSVMLWAGTVFLGMCREKPVSPNGILVGVAIIANQGLVKLPVLGVFFAAYAVVGGNSIALGLPFCNAATGAALMIVQVVLTLFWIDAAAAKYRRADLPALQASRGLVLLAMFVAIGTVGMLVFDAAIPGPRQTHLDILTFQWGATIGLSMLLAVVPVNGAMECRRLHARGTAIRSAADTVSDLLIAIAAPTIILAIMAGAGSGIARDAASRLATDDATTRLGAIWLITIASCYAFVLTARGALYVCRRWFRSFRAVAFVMLFLLWIVVPGIDLGVAISRQKLYYDPIVTTFAFSQSPGATIALLWTDIQGPVLAGVIAQVALAVLLTGLSLLPKFRTGQPPTPEPTDTVT